MEPFENPGNFSEDVGLFEAATHTDVVEIPHPSPRMIVSALDGSDRDATVHWFTESLVARTGAGMEMLHGPAGAAEIMAAVTAHHADLLILPVPFGQNYRELGSDSLGSVADQLLLKSGCPVLCVREVQDQAHVQESLKKVFVPVAVADQLVPQALGWAFCVTPAGGRIDLVAVADRDVLAEASHLIPEQTDPRKLEPDQVCRAILRDIGAIVSAAQKRGTVDGRAVHVETRVGAFVPLVLEEVHGRTRMIIWGVTRDHSSPAFHRAVDLLLASTGAVLIV